MFREIEIMSMQRLFCDSQIYGFLERDEHFAFNKLIVGTRCCRERKAGKTKKRYCFEHGRQRLREAWGITF